MKRSRWTLSILLLFFFISFASAREHIRIVGSSTVFPFISTISEEFARTFRVKTPMVESTGTSAGFKLFCMGVGELHPDLVVSSRKINDVELALCKIYGVSAEDIIEMKLGEDALVIASSSSRNFTYDFSTRDIFSAISFYFPHEDILVKNEHKKWSDIDHEKFGDNKIKIYGPTKNTGTFEAIKRMILMRHCLADRVFNLSYRRDKLSDICSLTRDDGVYVETSGDENVIAQKLLRNQDAFGIFSYSFYMRAADGLSVHKVNGVEPTYPNILSGKYELSRPLYIYLKKPHLDFVPNLGDLVKEVLSENALGRYGYLRTLGIVPLDDDALAKLRTMVESMEKKPKK